MELKIGESLNLDPANADIERAIDAMPHAAGWHIHLQSNGDDYIEAFAGKDGLYRVAFVDRGRRFNGARPVDGDTLKTILVEYLNDDADWRDACGFVPEKLPGGARAGRRISSEPPPWAVIVVAAAFFGSIPMFYIVPEAFGIAWLLAGPMAVMGLAMLANKMMQARRAAAWPQAAGRITKSGVAATRHASAGGATAVTNAPAIEYAFSANGRAITGTRISIGEDTGGANTEATLAHYPVGTAVVVYYDPADPENCVLEREIPKDVPKGCALVLAIVVALLLGGHWMFVHFLTFIAPYTQDGQGRLMVGTTIGGLVALMLFAGSWFAARERVTWPVARGRIEKSGTENFRKRTNRSTVSVFAPAVEYSYRVNQHEYRGRQITLGEEIDGARAQAQAVAARYPVGSEVAVHYDPENPGDAALEVPAPGRVAWVLLGIAAVCFGVAAYAGGVFR